VGRYLPLIRWVFCWSFAGFYQSSIPRLLPSICSQAFRCHCQSSVLQGFSFAGFSVGHSWVTADHSFAGYGQPFVRRLPPGHSQLDANHSFAGYCQPLACRLSTHSQATTDHSIAGFLAVIHGLLLTIHSQNVPTGHSRATADHSFAGYRQPFVHRLSTGQSRASADRSIIHFLLTIHLRGLPLTIHPWAFRRSLMGFY
jgi:hypothetical protein